MTRLHDRPRSVVHRPFNRVDTARRKRNRYLDPEFLGRLLNPDVTREHDDISK